MGERIDKVVHEDVLLLMVDTMTCSFSAAAVLMLKRTGMS